MLTVYFSLSVVTNRILLCELDPVAMFYSVNIVTCPLIRSIFFSFSRTTAELFSHSFSTICRHESAIMIRCSHCFFFPDLSGKVASVMPARKISEQTTEDRERNIAIAKE